MYSTKELRDRVDPVLNKPGHDLQIVPCVRI